MERREVGFTELLEIQVDWQSIVSRVWAAAIHKEILHSGNGMG